MHSNTRRDTCAHTPHLHSYSRHLCIAHIYTHIYAQIYSLHNYLSCRPNHFFIYFISIVLSAGILSLYEYAYQNAITITCLGLYTYCIYNKCNYSVVYIKVYKINMFYNISLYI